MVLSARTLFKAVCIQGMTFIFVGSGKLIQIKYSFRKRMIDNRVEDCKCHANVANASLRFQYPPEIAQLQSVVLISDFCIVNTPSVTRLLREQTFLELDQFSSNRKSNQIYP